MGFLSTYSDHLIIGQKNCQLDVFDLAKKSTASWAEAFNINNPQALSEARDELLGIAIEPQSLAKEDEASSIICWGASFTVSLRVPTAADIATYGVKTQKRPREDEDLASRGPPTSFSSATLKHKYTDLLALELSKHGEMLAVERPLIDLLPSLPAAVYTRQYGKA